MAMRSIDEFDVASIGRVCGVFTDVDGTLTDGGKLPAAAYEAMWRLREAGILVVPVTGRPAGWCDLIARQWPADAVVGENGAFAFYEDADGTLRCLLHPAVSSGAAGRLDPRLAAIRDAVLVAVPEARVAADQPYRLFDLAIDFAEEEPRLGLEVAERIRRIFVAHGAHAKISSIHVNGWFGDYDKLSMTSLLMQQRWGVDLQRDQASYVFCGDSPNDEPMFGFFKHSCGVANIGVFVSNMRQLPAYVATRSGGAGFAEIVQRLLEVGR